MTYIIIMVICFALLMAIRIPIPFALLASTLVYYFGVGLPLDMVVVRLLRSFDSFILLAIPFFVLAGKIMSEADISDRLIRIADLIVGRVKGSLAYVNIVVSMFFGGITGTAISDTTAIGSVMIPTMVKEGYSKRFSAAVTAASSTMGPIIPPSLMFIIYGSIAQVSIRDLFLAGAIPGLLVGLITDAGRQNHRGQGRFSQTNREDTVSGRCQYPEKRHPGPRAAGIDPGQHHPGYCQPDRGGRDRDLLHGVYRALRVSHHEAHQTA